jgi:SAM-dependent methyltransferase
MTPRRPDRDRYALYEASVQAVESDLDLFERVHRAIHGRSFHTLREDFCGTAQLACAWAMRGPERRAWGVDLDPRPLAWARRHHFPAMREAAGRVRLLRRDVRSASGPRVDAICAMNFSWWVFHERRELVRYFRVARRALRPGGLLFASAFGGTEAMASLIERRRIPVSSTADGHLLPAFTYEWEHAHFDPITHRIRCYIHFRFRDGARMRRAFRYDWRMWTLPEAREALAEAGFARSEVYVEGTDPRTGAGNGVYRRRRRFENQEGWLALVVGVA